MHPGMSRKKYANFDSPRIKFRFTCTFIAGACTCASMSPRYRNNRTNDISDFSAASKSLISANCPTTCKYNKRTYLYSTAVHPLLRGKTAAAFDASKTTLTSPPYSAARWAVK